MIQLDIATVLFVYTTSVFAGALAFLGLFRTNRNQPGLVALTIGFLEIGAASMVASGGAQSLFVGPVWTNLSFFLGSSGYMTVYLGIRIFGRPFTWRLFPLTLIVPGTTVLLAATGYWADDQVRFSLFHGIAGLASALIAFELVVGRRREPLPTQAVFAATEVAAALIFWGEVLAIWTTRRYIEFLAWGFVVQIFLNFFTGIFVYALVKEKTEAALRTSAETDPLTGVGNRRWFFARVPDVCAEGDTVIMVDADHFKAINDQCGHKAGDLALLFLVQKIRSALRFGEVFARFGGEEFALYLPRTGVGEAVRVAERLRSAVEEEPFVHDGHAHRLTISLGLCTAREGQSVDSALVSADRAVYRAKADGRNRVCVG